MKYKLILTALLSASALFANAQDKPEETEVYSPVPPVVIPGKTFRDAPSDAIILFDGTNQDQWVLTADRSKLADWIVGGGELLVNKKSGNIETKKRLQITSSMLNGKYLRILRVKGRPEETAGCFWLLPVKAMAVTNFKCWTPTKIKRTLTAWREVYTNSLYLWPILQSRPANGKPMMSFGPHRHLMQMVH